MANVINKYQSINLDTEGYTAVNLTNHHCFYLIGKATDKTIKQVVFAIAVDSGYQNNPIFVQNIILNVDPRNELNGQRFTGFPSEFWMKPVQVVTTDEVNHFDENWDIEININPMDFA